MRPGMLIATTITTQTAINRLTQEIASQVVGAKLCTTKIKGKIPMNEITI